MKKIIALFAALMLLPGCLASAQEFAELPDCFDVTYVTDTRKIMNDKAYVSKEYVQTVQPSVDAAIREIVDRYDDTYSPLMTPKSNPLRNSRLDINVVHSVSGQSIVSFKVLARTTLSRKQQQSPFECHTYDMATGREVFLTDIFPEDSAAWDVLSACVRETLTAYFPGEEPDAAALDAICSREGLMSANFMLGPVCLSLHYEASDLYPSRPTLMRVSIPYSAFEGMMTEYGAVQTDNSMYKMVALTFDDGPSYTNTARAIKSLRHAGAGATFFLLGNLIDEYPDIVMRQNDENHSIQSHHYNHVNSEKTSASRLKSNSQKFNGILSNVTGTVPIMMRPPYGTWRPFVKAGVNLPQILWDVDTKDWTDKSPKAVLNTVKRDTKHGSIILMHDIGDNTYKSVDLITEWLREENYLCVTVEDLFHHTGRELEPGKSYTDAIP